MEALASLGIDLWSIVVYMANTGLVLIGLTYFLYKPLLRIIDARRKTIADSIEEAKELKDEFSRKLEESEKEKKQMEADLKEQMANMQTFLERKRKELTHEMDQSRSEMMQKAQKEIEKQKAALLKDAEKELLKIMQMIVLDIVQNKVPEKVIQESIHDSWKSYQTKK